MDKLEYIDRIELIERIKAIYCAGCDTYNKVCCRACLISDALDCIADAPAADVTPVVHARWEPYQTPIETRQSGWICTNCSGVQKNLSNGDTEYCPHCGAIMDGGEQDG